MKSIGLYYFSGTGNTQLVSLYLKQKLESLESTVTLNSIDINTKPMSLETINNHDIIGIGYPIYGLGTPKLVTDFVQSLPEVKFKNVFLYKTAGDFITLNHAASYYLIKQLSKKGYNVYYDRIIAISSNWLVEYDKKLVKQLYLAALNKIDHIAKEVICLKRRLYNPNILLRAVARVIVYFEHRGARIFGRSLYVTNNCTKCMKCVQSCPNNNISINHEINFGSNCLWCMRCIYTCPHNAIKSKGMGFCIHKTGYNLQNIIDDNTIEPNYITENTKGFYKHFYKYIIDESM